MDPQATLRLMIEAAKDDDPQAFNEAAEDLVNWIRKGGWKPQLRGWPLGVKVLAYSTSLYTLKCYDPCTQLWLVGELSFSDRLYRGGWWKLTP